MTDSNHLSLPVRIYQTKCFTYDELSSVIEKENPEQHILFKEQYRKHPTMWLLTNL